MKKVIKGIIVITIVIITFIFINHVDNNYSIEGYVYDIKEGNVIIIEDVTSNLWSWEEPIEGRFNKGNKVKIQFYNNNSIENRIDDIITNVNLSK